MAVMKRRYRLLGDFQSVLQFLQEEYSIETLNSYLLPQFFEYAHTHPAFNHQKTHRFALWEEENMVVGVVCYEMDMGECFFVVKDGYYYLLSAMLAHGEEELSVIKDDSHVLHVWITDKEGEKRALLENKGYKKIHTEPVTIFPYEKEFPTRTVPQGFSILSLEDENDIAKIHACLWKGFDHGPDPSDDIDCRLLMQSGPNFRKDLTTIIKAPTGEYACYAGMWFDEVNQYAYLEPLATVPEYRGLGLGTLALTEGMKKTKDLGACYCFGGSLEYYHRIGFKTICHRELWRKEW